MHALNRRRATALLMVLAMLGLLSVLAVSLARLTHIERDASTARVDATRARFLAFAGIEHALSEIRDSSTRPYDGPDVDWFYRGLAGNAAGNAVPLRQADTPSFLAGTAFGRPYSGTLPDTFEALGDTYVLRILDSASMIDLNAPADPRLADANQPLVRMLVNLARAVNPVSPPLNAAEAEMIFAFRQTLPGAEFTEREDLLAVPGSPLDQARYEEIAEFVTVYAWSDPNSTAPMDPALAPATSDDVFNRFPTGDWRRLARRPVNINTAPGEVLVAVLADVEALYVEEDVPRNPEGSAKWQSQGTAQRTTAVAFNDAVDLATAILIARETTPFRHWTDFATFLDGQVVAGTIDARQAAALLANCDPNVNTRRANPDAPFWKEIDKFDLLASTTEFCFQSMGLFEIESIGRLTHNGGVIKAEASIRTVLEAFQVVRHTTQAQFQGGTPADYTLREPILWKPDLAVVVQEDITIGGSIEILGLNGHVHSNSDMRFTGKPTIEGDATATGTFTGNTQNVGGVTGGGFPPQLIPSITPSKFLEVADYVFQSDGTVLDSDGNVVATGSYAGWSKSGSRWSWSGGTQLPGAVLYFEGDAKMTANTALSWEVTLVATGSIEVQGKPQVTPDQEIRLTVIAGTDIKISGTPGAVISGLLFAGEQLTFSGNVDFYGAAVAKGQGATDNTVSSNSIGGNVKFHYNGDLDPVPLDWLLTDLPTVVTYPEPDATAIVGGSGQHLPSFTDYDGWIGLATRTTNRALLGGEPYNDLMMARWFEGSLDGDLGGGSLTLSADLSGPVIQPLAGTNASGHLLPDGVYSEWDAVGAFEATGNVGPTAGTIAFWMKPRFDSTTSNRTRHFLSMSRTAGSDSQSFQFARTGDLPGSWDQTTGFHFERTALENNQADRLVHSTWEPPAHRWTHIVLTYDFDQTDYTLGIQCFVNGVALPSAVFDFTGTYALSPGEQAASIITPGNLIRLGERIANDYQLSGQSAEATIDELICLPDVEDAAWAANLYGEGRYYNEGLAEYVSSALSTIPNGSRLLGAAWTIRYPDGWAGPMPTLQVEEAGTPVGSTTAAEGFEIDTVIDRDVRYRIIFLAADPGVPLHEFPGVDAVTISFFRETRVVIWEE